MDDIQTYIRTLTRKAREFATEKAHYLSTACHHELHDQCRQTCKFCTEKCQCKCHERAWS